MIPKRTSGGQHLLGRGRELAFCASFLEMMLLKMLSSWRRLVAAAGGVLR